MVVGKVIWVNKVKNQIDHILVNQENIVWYPIVKPDQIPGLGL